MWSLFIARPLPLEKNVISDWLSVKKVTTALMNLKVKQVFFFFFFDRFFSLYTEYTKYLNTDLVFPVILIILCD